MESFISSEQFNSRLKCKQVYNDFASLKVLNKLMLIKANYAVYYRKMQIYFAFYDFSKAKSEKWIDCYLILVADDFVYVEQSFVLATACQLEIWLCLNI